MDESHFEDTGARIFKYCFFIFLVAITWLGVWKKDAIMGFFSFREFGEARITIYAVPGTAVSLVEENARKRELGLVGRDGKFTLVEQGDIHQVRVHLSHPYYFPEERLFEHVGKGEVAYFQAAMAPLLGNIKVTSFPDGATLFINDKEEGKTPWSKRDIRDGTRMLLEARMDGFISQRKEVVIEAGRTEELVFSLIPSESMISLETNKEDFAFESLKVFIDGELYSMNGQLVRFIQPGLRKVEVLAYDGLKLQKTINIKPGQTIHLTLPDWFVEDGS